MDRLTPKQQALCDFLRQFTQERGYPPTVREIGEHLGLRSTSSVHFHLKKLLDAGIVYMEPGKTRSITLVEEALPPEGQIPLLGNVAAGSPILAEECIEEYIPFDTGGRPEEYFALRVRGESMLGAGILPDDLVVVRRQQSASSGEIVVALLGDEATVKRLSHRNGGVWLLPENDAFQPIDGRNALVLGKVTAVVRQYS